MFFCSSHLARSSDIYDDPSRRPNNRQAGNVWDHAAMESFFSSLNT
jgi:hypothetical protein